MIEEIKEYLRIIDNDGDAYINSLLEQGQIYLNDLAGVKLDFKLNTSAKILLKDYCRYAYNNATEYFESNYSLQIQRLILESAVVDNVKQKTNNEQPISSI